MSNKNEKNDEILHENIHKIVKLQKTYARYCHDNVRHSKVVDKSKNKQSKKNESRGS